MPSPPTGPTPPPMPSPPPPPPIPPTPPADPAFELDDGVSEGAAVLALAAVANLVATHVELAERVQRAHLAVAHVGRAHHAYCRNIPAGKRKAKRVKPPRLVPTGSPGAALERGLTSQRNMNMPMWSCSSRVTLSARRSVLPSGSNSSSRLSAPFLSWVHTSISSWQYANVQFSPYWHSWRSCTSV
ncbi:hypothetical protein EYF80_038420 [Liparis tanakae]|uniref:Uncharacterized protein n=1 Tax=Liparis tanakae TaxID=230148 RepID=A0A4Z2GER1_9TELE|nr:hypothetical protein EYF80_038420 [Liparis tanakae]